MLMIRSSSASYALISSSSRLLPALETEYRLKDGEDDSDSALLIPNYEFAPR